VSDARSSSAIATTGIADSPRPYRGRFAPSPSGPLHFGSLVAAVGSFLEARSHGGQWLVRIEDLDPPRVKPGAAEDILATLDRLGLHWDGPVLFQSARTAAYVDAIEHLAAQDRLRPCRCSRSLLAGLPVNRNRTKGDEIFHPAQCPPEAESPDTTPTWRFRAPDRVVEFLDRVQGIQQENVARTVGDFVLRRRDGLVAYQLAVVVDDAAQGVTHVVRGMDLLASTARQILLQEALGVPRPGYLHLPLAVDESGLKLSKSDDAPALTGVAPSAQVVAALDFMRQAPPPELARAPLSVVWAWAIANWQPQHFAGVAAARASDRTARSEGPQ
jgi:glutamyl-Q tRNA(Asp) synthetase